MYLDRYLFAMPYLIPDDGGGIGGGQGDAAAVEVGSKTGTGTDGGADDKKVELPKTPEDLAKLIQAETEKALKTTREKWQKEYGEKLAAEKAEAARLAKLSAEEREKELEKKRKVELDQREATIRQQELTLKATDILTEKKLPLEIRSMVIGKDEADTKARIEAFEGVFQKAVEAAVNEKLAGSAKPGAGKEPDDEASLRAAIAAGLRG